MEGERKDKGGEERGEGDYCKRGREGGSGKSRERDEERQESKEERGEKERKKITHDYKNIQICMFITRRRILHNAECCQGEQGLRKKRKEGRGGEKSTLEGKEGAIDVKRGREEIWKRIREREQLIRWGEAVGRRERKRGTD